tara:strand:+ start:117 stop:785 length:669 start_codon:yes stop_codon:yes gene_type:complete
MKNNIIVFAAHPDDEVLGCGGTIARHASEGDIVTVVFACDGESSRENGKEKINSRYKSAAAVSKILGCNEPIFLNFKDNRLDDYNLLDIVKKIEEIINKIKPSIVYTHSKNDLNIDHQLIFKSVLTACRPLPGSTVQSIFSFEIPSSTEWNISEDTFIPQRYVNITKFVEKKTKALKMYDSEMRNFPHPRSYKVIEAIQNFRGATSGFNAAEAFAIIREIQK